MVVWITLVVTFIMASVIANMVTSRAIEQSHQDLWNDVRDRVRDRLDKGFKPYRVLELELKRASELVGDAELKYGDVGKLLEQKVNEMIKEWENGKDNQN